MRWERLLKILLTSNGFYTCGIKQQFFQPIDYEVVKRQQLLLLHPRKNKTINLLLRPEKNC